MSNPNPSIALLRRMLGELEEQEQREESDRRFDEERQASDLRDQRYYANVDSIARSLADIAQHLALIRYELK
jgi:hypothetical protein